MSAKGLLQTKRPPTEAASSRSAFYRRSFFGAAAAQLLPLLSLYAGVALISLVQFTVSSTHLAKHERRGSSRVCGRGPGRCFWLGRFFGQSAGSGDGEDRKANNQYFLHAQLPWWTKTREHNPNGAQVFPSTGTILRGFEVAKLR